MENNIEMFNDIKVNNVLIKGGHLNGNKVTDLLLNNGKVYKFYKRTHSIDYFNDTNTQLYSSGGVSFHSKSKISKENHS